jgi:uncharacterized protein (TIGR02996 family)
MTDEPALLAAVAAAPDDDTPRLVYADWLDDHGRPERAEFIRVQCRLAAASPADDDYPLLLDQQAELVARLKTFDPPPPPRHTDPPRVHDHDLADYERGFPATVTWYVRSGNPADFRRGLPALEAHLAASPARSLETVGLTAVEAAEFVNLPLLANLRGLTLAVSDDSPFGRAGVAVAEALASSPHVKHLRRLNLVADLTDDALAVLAGADLSGLADLTLGMSVAATRALARLAAASWFQNLRVLRLREHLGDVHLETLAALPPMPRLHTLDLADNRFEWVGLRALAESKSFPSLAALDLSRNPLGEEGAGYLGKAAWSVRELRLRACAIGDRGVKSLLAGKLLDGVRVLELGNADLTATGIKALAASPKLAAVRHLDLQYNRVGKDGFAALAASPHFQHLTRLDIGVFSPGESRVKGEVIADFLNTLDAPNLRRLGLSAIAVGLAGAKALATRPTFANLRALELQESRIGTKALAELAASPHLRGLVELDLWMNEITAASPLLDPAVFPNLAACRLQNNPLPPEHAKELSARRGLQTDAAAS